MDAVQYLQFDVRIYRQSDQSLQPTHVQGRRLHPPEPEKPGRYAKTSGHYDFGDNSADPYDTGFGFANAAIGTFYSFTDAIQYVTGQYRYTNAEFYLQDTWKIKPSLTVN